MLARLIVDKPEQADDSRNAALDARIDQALEALTMPALPAGSPLPSGVDEAEVIPD